MSDPIEVVTPEQIIANRLSEHRLSDRDRTFPSLAVEALREHGLLADQYEQADVNGINAVSWLLAMIERGVPVFVRRETE